MTSYDPKITALFCVDLPTCPWSLRPAANRDYLLRNANNKS
jgi:hypothetical protein